MSTRIAVVGAGPSGLMAARTLRGLGLEAVVFDKGRRPGGRVGTREHSEHRFDHGAQYFTVRDPAIRSLLDGWLKAGVVAEWTGALVRIDGNRSRPATPGPRYVGVPGMIGLCGHLAQDLDVRCGVRIVGVTRAADTWTLTDEDGRTHGDFHNVIVAVPAPQAIPLVEAAPALQARAAAAEMAPTWAAMFAFEDPLPLDFDGAFISTGPLSWAARDSSKPGRPAGERWVLHATPEWTRAHGDIPRERVAGHLLDAFRTRFGALPEPSFRRAHRWGYALPTGDTSAGAAFDATTGVGLCGDWCVGGRVEGALLSGMDVARQLARTTADGADGLEATGATTAAS